MHLPERDLRRLRGELSQDVRGDARIQALEEVDSLFGTRVVNDERRFPWHALVEKTRDLVGVVPEVLGVQSTASLELGWRRRLR
jgi:hypothetical protein